MSKLIRLFWLLFTGLAALNATSAGADERLKSTPLTQTSLAQISTRLEGHAVVRAEFVQSKKMTALKRPLVTRGRLLISRQSGLVWQIDQPYRVWTT